MKGSLDNSGTVGPADGEILIDLRANHHPIAGYMKKLRKELPKRFPNMTMWFQPADIATQVLNFGIPAPIDVQVVSTRAASEQNLAIAQTSQGAADGVRNFGFGEGVVDRRHLVRQGRRAGLLWRHR